ncbi:CPCC family cysteine-rich protein [Flavitalea sp. BT771]|uniref:CPCC family cysteine-rich protein n=1 Tax=Flavitalea sp. BT771 TaxID=3063329 RepID=UPI0026E30E92|nr:CPCC family cysteine-rich protein [Flavitalea sp. BT771]MDO6433164.1 CPCC family cysteine-rich protein [Flavitalea sp. BT771]MDV6221560.1 CPCC family cysteine-rich protein [Flavitalea sp. BT771]
MHLQTGLSEDDNRLIAAFHAKRKLFDDYIRVRALGLFTCPGCGYPTLHRRGDFSICEVCFWEDDGEDDETTSVVADALTAFGGVSGPNGQLTLTQNRLNIGRQLEENAAATHGVPDLEPASVLKTLDVFKTKREKIEEKLSPDAQITDPAWQELKNLREDLKRALAVSTHFPYDPSTTPKLF